jgi:hypothetical protein
VTIDGFYEDDEPVADVVAAFDRAPKGLTAPPSPTEGGPAAGDG